MKGGSSREVEPEFGPKLTIRISKSVFCKFPLACYGDGFYEIDTRVDI